MDLKTKNARMKLEQPDARTVLEQAAKLNELQGMIKLAGGNPALWDFPQGFVLSNAQTGSAASTNKLDLGKTVATRGGMIVRITTTIGATPTCTFAIQGSNDAGFSSPISLLYSDSPTPATFVSSTFVITTASTFIKYVKPGQSFRYLRLNYTANTNVTITADVTPQSDN